MARKARSLRAHVRRYGPGAGVRLAAANTLAAARLLRVAVCYTLPDAARALAHLPRVSGLEIRVIPADEATTRAAAGEEWFFPRAVADSITRGEVCYGGYLDGTLVCSAWYATRPLRQLGAVVDFAPDCLWEHRLYTKPPYRGRGLSTALKRPAIEAFGAAGRSALLNAVEWHNAGSRRLHERLGYQRVGTLVRFGSLRHGRTELVGGERVGLRIVRAAR